MFHVRWAHVGQKAKEIRVAFWGDQDEEMGPEGTEQLAYGLDRHGLQHVSFPGYDHEGMLTHLNDAVPNVLAWLDQL